MLVFRVHWLKARAQLKRWQEEFRKLRNEMVWVVTFFEFQGRNWTSWVKSNVQLTPGQLAYAARQQRMWCMLAADASIRFKKVRPDFTPYKIDN